jgi:hypothetical protein
VLEAVAQPVRSDVHQLFDPTLLGGTARLAPLPFGRAPVVSVQVQPGDAAPSGVGAAAPAIGGVHGPIEAPDTAKSLTRSAVAGIPPEGSPRRAQDVDSLRGPSRKGGALHRANQTLRQADVTGSTNRSVRQKGQNKAPSPCSAGEHTRLSARARVWPANACVVSVRG